MLPRTDVVLRGLIGLHLLAPLVYWLAIAAVARYATAVFMVSALGMLVVGGWCAFKRMRSAYFFLAAFSLLMVGSMVTTLRTFGWLPTNVFTVDGMQLGSSLEMLMLAFALADRFNQMRREKLLAERELTATQQRLLETLQASEQELAQRVEERTRQLQAANARLEALSMVDGLTSIANRRHFDQVLHKEWTRLERVGQPLALVMLDVDWFKRYNDHFGHQAGDECLRAVAQAISGVSRASDLVARYGGEEFVLVAPATDGPQALWMAQRACEAVVALAMPHPRAPAQVVTVSCGVAVVIPGPDSSLQALLGEADDALYEAKAQGRNRVVLAEPLGS
jgi:diguanylate cyclase (GGDEF)-like protein